MGHPNHRWPLPSKFWKPSKNHWYQWLGPQKTFNVDGPTLSKPLKNHWSQWWPEKNINHSIALKNWPSFWSSARTKSEDIACLQALCSLQLMSKHKQSLSTCVNQLHDMSLGWVADNSSAGRSHNPVQLMLWLACPAAFLECNHNCWAPDRCPGWRCRYRCQ